MRINLSKKTSDRIHVDTFNEIHRKKEARKKRFTVVTMDLLNYFDITSPTFNQPSTWLGLLQQTLLQ